MSLQAPSHVPIAEFRNVTKWYGAVIGLNGVSLQIAPGITGLLGPNGAGKTTLIKLLTGQLQPSLGDVFVRGRPAVSAGAKRFIGYCPDADVLYEEMSGREFVLTMARLHGFDSGTAQQRTDAALTEVDMLDRANQTLRGCSKGMRQRIKLAQSLIHDPDLLIVDEPLNGIDPVGRRELMDFFRRFRDRGKAVLVSSHILEEMDALADEVIFMGRGRILAQGTLPEIREMLAEHPQRVRIRTPQARELAMSLIGLDQVRGVELPHEHEILLQVQQPDAFFRKFSSLIVEQPIELISVETTDICAEAIFDYVIAASGPGI
jgi:ABC-2 type transport system ATP-binding protein